MSLRINNSNIAQMKINSSNIQLAKINGEIVFQFDSATIKLTFTDKTIKAISDTTGSYDFYYANANGIIKEFEKIATFNLSANVTSSYTSLNSFNIAPYKATKIVVCKSGTTNILSSSSLPTQFKFDSSTYGTKLYSVGLVSDTHIDGDGTDTADSINDFKKALTLFKNENVSFIAHCGDVTEDNRTNDYTAFSNMVADNTIPIKTIAGNHDSYSTLQSITGNSLYYEYTPDGTNDIYLFLGSYQASTTNPFSNEELTWLETKLEEYKNKRVFLFFHYYCEPVGDANNLDNDDLGTTGQAKTFRDLMTTYKDNIIYISGHSHLTYKLQEKVSTANINSTTDTLPKRVHIPSTGRPRILTNGSVTNEYVGSECAIMDVYENCIVIRGKDLNNNKFLPIANYLLDTTMINDSNLFNYSTASVLDAYISRSSKTIKTSDADNVTYCQIEPNTTYKVTKVASKRFVILTLPNKPAIGEVGTNVADDYTGTELTITSGTNDKYLAIQYYYATNDTLTEEEIRKSIVVAKV